jgi:hypothetical protein
MEDLPRLGDTNVCGVLSCSGCAVPAAAASQAPAAAVEERWPRLLGVLRAGLTGVRASAAPAARPGGVRSCCALLRLLLLRGVGLAAGDAAGAAASAAAEPRDLRLVRGPAQDSRRVA